jgi:hypothetical protein
MLEKVWIVFKFSITLRLKFQLLPRTEVSFQICSTLKRMYDYTVHGDRQLVRGWRSVQCTGAGLEALSCSWWDPLKTFCDRGIKYCIRNLFFIWLCDCELLMIMPHAVTSFQGPIFKSGAFQYTVVLCSPWLPRNPDHRGETPYYRSHTRNYHSTLQ